nr:MAG TPA_asm: hypothetical protein [Caudoviricetes sp.]
MASLLMGGTPGWNILPLIFPGVVPGLVARNG